MPRIKYCAGNWKLNKSPAETKKFIAELRALKPKAKCEVIIFPPAYNLPALNEAISESLMPISFGPQNIYFKNDGAFTGEISPSVAKEMGSQYALIGHSERRLIFSETDDLCAKKVKAALDTGLTPVFCIGEILEERESNQTNSIIERQLRKGLALVTEDIINFFDKKIIIAYEPVWAIGTGRVATPEQAEEAHKFVRQMLSEIFNSKIAERTSILYGGSVKPDNSSGLINQPNIDGFLIGGASLKPADFAALLEGTY